MKVSNKTFDNWRLYAEILSHILAFALLVSETVGFKYGVELTMIVEGFNIMVGNILNALRKAYNGEGEDTDDECMDN